MNVEKHLGKDTTYKLEELYEDFIPEENPYQILQIYNWR